MKTGQVIGSTDRHAAAVKDRPLRFGDVFATLPGSGPPVGLIAHVDVSPDAYRLETAVWTSSQFGPTRDGPAPVEGQFHWLWPVTKAYALPGPPNLVAGPLVPRGPERTYGFFDYFFPEDVPDAEVDELIAFDDQVGSEDRALVESVQQGTRSGLVEAGRLMPVSERLIAQFQGLVREALA